MPRGPFSFCEVVRIVTGMTRVQCLGAAVLLAVMCGSVRSQTPSIPPPAPASAPLPPQVDAGQPAPADGQRSARPVEAPVAGMTRRDPATIAISLEAAKADETARLQELLLHGFSFDGDAVTTNKLHFKQLAPGVLEVTSLAYSLGEWQFLLRDRGNYYGLGERFDTLNHAHTVVRNASMDNGDAKGASTYKPMPFFMSTSGYGLWVDTTSEAVFDMNASQLNEVQVTVPAMRLRLVIFTSHEFPKMLEAFTKLTQRAVVPPVWAFAPWMGRSFPGGDAAVRETVDKARALGLPGSVLLMDEPWETSFNSYKFNTRQFTDAAGDVKHVHDAGYKLVLWHTPWINSKSNPPGRPELAGKTALHAEDYDEAAANHFFVRRPDGAPWVGRWWMGEGSLIDFTSALAKAWWQDQLRGAIHAGADGFKDDDAEGNFQGEVKFADGTPKELMRNRYAVLYNNAVEEVILKELKGNGVVFGRSATAGANGLGFLWGGDNESSFSRENGLPSVITAGLNAGISGIPLWTADVGGYINSPTAHDATLLARWTEFAAFSPVMEVFSSTNALPWDWPAEAFAVYRRYAALHMSLMPYRYAAAKEAAATGMPILRALPLVYQDDAAARQAREEYLFGPSLLVAPVADENTRRPVYLPAGQWVDYWTGAPVTGGRTVVVDAPLDVIPVYARAGAVIAKIPDDVLTLVPAAESGNTTLKTMDDRRVFELVGGTPAEAVSFTDFEDRAMKREGTTLTIGAAKQTARVTVRWRFEHPAELTVDGKSLPAVSDGAGSAVEFALAEGKSAVVSWR